MSEITFRSDVKAELIDSMGEEQSIVRAARVSTLGTKAEASEAEGLVRFLMREGHGTPFEAPVLTIRFEAPIFVTRQLRTHRLASINEESGRYKELEPVFYVPSAARPVKQVGKTGAYQFVSDDRALEDAQGLIQAQSVDAWWTYVDLLERDVAKEVSRMVLPVNIFSTMYFTANLRSWLNFVKLRTYRYGSHPQFEIAEIGEQVHAILEEKFPVVMDQYQKETKI